jgi:urea carboxylase
LRDYNHFLESEADSITAFRETQRRAFTEERARWEAAGIFKKVVETAEESHVAPESAVPEGCEAVEAAVAGNVWKVLVKAGDPVTAEQPVLVLEAMKMEIAIPSPGSGIIEEVFVSEGSAVQPGQALMALRANGS